ncbi:MAG: family 78 glycoside hydrolase catalytic domain [Fermentimonas sp.]|nr:family 78 glycoside hydrolase catalytic domain [Fermentimonas sp.]MDD4697089.1 family 78 glycoside hydrolase catalytic domain [Fermentimonas sp.]
MKEKFLFVLLGLLFFCTIQISAFEPVNLTCDKMESPLMVTSARPEFGWQIISEENGKRQTAYEIEIYDFVEDKDILFQSTGKTMSSKSQGVYYDGNRLLEPLKRYSWRVRVWDEKDIPSEWSEKNFFRMAPSSVFLNAKWIGSISREDSKLPKGRKFHSTVLKRPENRVVWEQVNPLSHKSIYLRHTFDSEKTIKEAVAYVSGLGLYEFSLNGEKVGNSEFAPLLSDYDKTVYYNAYDVTDYLIEGSNAVGILLGNGFYNVQGGRYRKLLISFGPPTLFFKMKITYSDGTTQEVQSGENWKFSYSPITFNCIYGGEDYDATLEQTGWDSVAFDDNNWSPVVVQEPPRGKLRAQQASPVKIMERFAPKETNKISDTRHVMDMGQNLAGFPEIIAKGSRGDTIRLTPGESLNEDGTVSQKQTGSKHYYEYVLKGEGEEYWHPRFTYYGFRYIQADLLPNSENRDSILPEIKEINSCFIYNSADKISTFESSNSIFNNAHRIIGNAVRSNMQSVFTDCPHREKLGWLEQVHLNGPGLYYNYDMRTFIPKVMQDIKDSQLPNGLVPSIAPEYVEFDGAFRDSPEWGSSSVIIPWMYFLYYGDSSLIHEYYDVMKRYVDYLSTMSTDHIVSHGLGDWYDYHGERAGFSKNTPVPLVATAHYYWDLILLKKAAKMVGEKEDEVYYDHLAEAVKAAFNNRFFDKTTHQYGSGSQASNAIPLFFELVVKENREAVLANLVKDIQNRGNRLTTGDVGNRYLFQTLARNDLNDLMYKMHNHEDVPGYGFQVNFGATTLTEQWDPREGTSWNHFMMGQIDEWFFAWLAGIQPDIENPGYTKFRITPQVVGDLTSVSASTKTLYGEIAVDWIIKNGIFTLNVQVPVNTEAVITLPNKEEHITGSGKHTFTIKL